MSVRRVYTHLLFNQLTMNHDHNPTSEQSPIGATDHEAAVHAKSSLRLEAEEVVNQHITWAAGAGFIPLPIADVAAVAAVQIDMIKSLCTIYNRDYDHLAGKALISSIAGGLMPRVVSSVFRKVPVIGFALGGLAMSAIASFSTYAIGSLFIKHFEKGGTLLDIDVAYFKRNYQRIMDQTREQATQFGDKYSQLMHQIENPVKLKFNVPFLKTNKDKLAELQELKEEGVITEFEYEERRQKILNDMEN